MRCLLKKKTILVAVLLLIIGGTYLMKGPSGSPEPAVSELSRRADRLVSQESWVERGDFLPLNVSYQLLAGTQAARQSQCLLCIFSRDEQSPV